MSICPFYILMLIDLKKKEGQEFILNKKAS